MRSSTRKLYWVQDYAKEHGIGTVLKNGVLLAKFSSAKAAADFAVEMMVRYKVAADIRGFNVTMTEHQGDNNEYSKRTD